MGIFESNSKINIKTNLRRKIPLVWSSRPSCFYSGKLVYHFSESKPFVNFNCQMSLANGLYHRTAPWNRGQLLVQWLGCWSLVVNIGYFLIYFRYQPSDFRSLVNVGHLFICLKLTCTVDLVQKDICPNFLVFSVFFFIFVFIDQLLKKVCL